MNIFHKVTGRTLRLNRTRTGVTIIGILLSAAMITAVVSLVVSAQAFFTDMACYENGNWHTRLVGVSETELEELRSDNKIEDLCPMRILGSAKMGGEEDNEAYLYMLETGEEAADFLPLHLLSGRMPENAQEILLPGIDSFKNMLGKTLTLRVGQRMYEGEALDAYNSYITGEEFVEVQECTYTVVGYYNSRYCDIAENGYAVFIGLDGERIDAKYDVYFRTEDPKDAYLWPNDDVPCGGEYNKFLLLFQGASGHNSYYSVLYGLASVIIVLILLGSISLIYNAFSISVSDRTRQFGILSSVGATRRQLRSSVLYEALLLGGIGVPLGIACGLLGIWITILCIGKYVTQAIAGLTTIDGGFPILTMHVSWQSMLISWLIGMGTVLVSAWIPAYRATRVSAVEAIRGSRDIRAGKGKLHGSRLICRIFGLEGLLAGKYFKRDRKKYRATILSLFMSIVLFISSASFIIYLEGAVGQVMNPSSYDLYYYTEQEDENLFQELAGAEGVEEAVRMHMFYTNLDETEYGKVTQAYREYLGLDEDKWISVFVLVAFADDETFVKYVTGQGEEAEKYMDPAAPKAVLCSTSRIFAGEKLQTIDYLSDAITSLKTETYTEDGTGTITLEHVIGSVQKKLFMDLEEYGCVLLYPESVMDTMLERMEGSYGTIRYFFTSSDHQKSYRAMQEILYAHGDFGTSLQDEREEEEMQHNVLLTIHVLSYGFIILISLIAAANVFNTISTNVALRRREFAMLRSVGMTQKGMNRMLCFECLIYGVKALVWGLPVSFLVTYWIYEIVSNGWDAELTMPWNAVLIAVLSIFIVVFATMMYAVRKIRKENLMDALKMELQ